MWIHKMPEALVPNKDALNLFVVKIASSGWNRVIAIFFENLDHQCK